MKYQLKIELKSDLCSGNGESYGALIDNDVCYDGYGLPYIPAKRLKGCLRDSAVELAGFGLYSKKAIDDLFGIKGQNKTCPLYIGDAYLETHEADIYAIENEKTHKEHLSAANVLNSYTYLRAQTAIERKTGIAKEKSLRYTRVVKKGTVFFADINIKNDLLDDSAKNLRSIGLNRNRGFGEVKISILDKCETNSEEKCKNIEKCNLALEAVESDCEKYRLFYTLTLKTPLLLAGHSEETETFIPGSSILGYFANHAWHDGDFKDFFNGNIIFGNAYISNGTETYYPAPAYITVGKYGGDVAYGSLVDFEVTDEDSNKAVKTESLGGKYCRFKGENIHIISVETDINYHLFREDAKEQSDDNFFQYTSIRKDQIFKGNICAQGKYIKKFIEHVKDNGEITLGKSKTAQYGFCKISIDDCKAAKGNACVPSNKFVVLLRSPLVLYNDGGMAMPDLGKFIAELKEKLKISGEVNILKRYTKVKTIGGYNVTWNLPKAQIPVFDAGSAFVIETESGETVDLSAINENRFGERTSEGFGELFAFDYSEAENSYKIIKDKQSRPDIKKPPIASNIVSEIVERIKKEELQKKAMETAKPEKIGINSTTIGRLILMLKESKTKTEFYKAINDIKDKDKKDKINAILKCPESQKSDAEFKTYMQTYLNQLKLLKRREDKS
ncbi:MAG: RAMP superfamily CRISPR-associated protein [Oscillospiraceae bacterium]|nr:RAMP superfamily CRISPR-associated protein [Oscillospiraceae bacterium]